MTRTPLTPNFVAEEFDIHEPFPARYAVNRLQLAQLLQRVRDLAGVPVVITSAWRSDARNESVGGTATSQHPKGEAADAVAWLIPLRSLAARVIADVKAGTFPPFGQIIFYPRQGHVHVSLPTMGKRNGEIRYSEGGAYHFLMSANQLPVWSAAQRGRGLWLALALGLIIAAAWSLWFVLKRNKRNAR